MKLIDQILRKPLYVAFGQVQQGSGITSVDLVAIRDATTVIMTASDGSAAPIAGADASTAGVMTAIDKSKLDDMPAAMAQDFSAKLDIAVSMIGPGISNLRTAGHSMAGDGGGALYKRVGSEPAHNLKIQSADLAWWEIVPLNNVLTFQACGGIEGDSAANGAANVAAFNSFIGYAQDKFAVGAFATGPTLQFPKGIYHFDTHLNVKASVTIQGAGTFGGVGNRSGTTLKFPVDSNGIIVQSAGTIDETTEASAFTGSATIIEGLYVKGGGKSDTTGHGIWLRAVAKIIGCWVTDFTLDGFHIVANVGGGPSTLGNANMWGLEDVSANNNGRHGVFVSQSDTNAGSGLRIDSKANGRWGIYDNSFLGNTWIACHTDGNGIATLGGNAADQSSYVNFGNTRYSANVGATEAQLVATTPGTDEDVWIKHKTGAASASVPLWTVGKPEGTYFHGGPYHHDDINAHSVFIGCYREDNQGENQIMAPALVYGGFMSANKANGFAMIGGTTGGNVKITGSAAFSNDETWFKTSSRQLDLVINGADEKIMRLSSGDAGFVNLLAWDEGDKVWMLGEVNNSSTQRPIRITSGKTVNITGGRASALAAGNIVFANGVFIGEGRFNQRHMTNGTVAPTTGEHGRGELVWNRNSAAGAVLGWVCVTAGTPGTWVEMRGVADQTSGANQAALTNSTGGTGDGTLAAVGDTSATDQSAVINGNLTELHTLLDEVRTTLVNFGMMKGGV